MGLHTQEVGSVGQSADSKSASKKREEKACGICKFVGRPYELKYASNMYLGRSIC
jgi:hypothetical protein